MYIHICPHLYVFILVHEDCAEFVKIKEHATGETKKQFDDFQTNIENFDVWRRFDSVYKLLGPVSAVIHHIESQGTTCSWVVVLFLAMVADATAWASDKFILQVLSAETIQKVLATMKDRWEGTQHKTGTVKKVRYTYIRI